MEGYLKKRRSLQNNRYIKEIYEFLIPITVDPRYRTIYSEELRSKLTNLYENIATHWHGKAHR